MLQLHFTIAYSPYFSDVSVSLIYISAASPLSNLKLYSSRPCSKFELLKILLGFETGSHVSSPKAEFIDCVAFRLDPISRGSFNNIDGEVVEPGRIQAYVQPSAIRFFS